MEITITRCNTTSSASTESIYMDLTLQWDYRTKKFKIIFIQDSNSLRGERSGVRNRVGARDFLSSTPALGSTQPPVQWPSAHFRVCKSAGEWRWLHISI